MKKNNSKNLIETFKRKVKSFPRKIFESLKNIFLFFPRVISTIVQEVKKHPKAGLRAFASFCLLGLGQARNKQWYKAIPLFLVIITITLIELLTSNYIYVLSGELSQFPATDGIFYFFRDYGGFFTRGIWGLISLGELVVGDLYRGETIVVFDKVFTWKSTDNSQVLLGEGIIALVLLLSLATVWIYSIVDAFKSYVLLTEENNDNESMLEFSKRIWEDFFAYLIITPAAVLILFFTLIPFLYSFLVAFTNWTSRIVLGQTTISWVGLDTFRDVLTNSDWLVFFWDVLGWTIIYAVFSSVTVYVLGFVQALIIEHKYVKHKKIFRAILILPWAIPGIISLMLFRNVFADNFGLMNTILNDYGLTEGLKTILRSLNLVNQVDFVSGSGNIFWLNEPANGNLAKVIILGVNLWLGYPYFMMLITGVLGTIPKSLYEAAEIDGATKYQRFVYITLPWVLRATAPVIITTFTYNFNNFGAIYFLSSGGPSYPIDAIPTTVRAAGAAPGQTDILISWIYKLTFVSNIRQYNLASVYSILIFIFISGIAIYNLSKLKSFWKED